MRSEGYLYSRIRDKLRQKEDRYCAYRFRGRVLGIMDDLFLEKDLSVPDIYSDTEGDGSEEVDSEVPFQDVSAVEETNSSEQETEHPKQETTEPTVVESTPDSNEEDNYDPFTM